MATKNSDGCTAACFLVAEDPDKPSTWHLQVKDADGTPNHTLMGAAWAALHEGYRGNKYEGPNKAEALSKLKALYKSENMPLPDAKMSDAAVTFGADLGDVVLDVAGTGTTHASHMGGDYVVRTGKLFEVGNYEDKGFEFTADDLARAVETFHPCGLNMEHVPTLLDGKLGHVERIFPGEDGKSLMGQVRLPKWLDTVLEDTGRKVSTEWDRATKSLKGLALVREPRVTDAALMAAFSADFAGKRHDTPSGQSALQMLHNMAASSGAVCKANMSSRHESSAIQDVHDMTVQHGASCENMSGGGGYPMFSDALSLMSQTHLPSPPTATSATPGAPTAPTTPKPRRSGRMNLREFLLGKAKEEGVELDAAELDAAFSTSAEVETLKTESAKREAEAATLRAEIETQKVEFARMRAERQHAEAVTFAQNAVASHRVIPAASDALTALAERITASDASVTFSDDEQPTLALLSAFIETLPDLSVFTTERVKAKEAAALFNQTTTPKPEGSEPNADIVKAMLAHTAVGREVLHGRNGSSSN